MGLIVTLRHLRILWQRAATGDAMSGVPHMCCGYMLRFKTVLAQVLHKPPGWPTWPADLPGAQKSGQKRSNNTSWCSTCDPGLHCKLRGKNSALTGHRRIGPPVRGFAAAHDGPAGAKCIAGNMPIHA